MKLSRRKKKTLPDPNDFRSERGWLIVMNVFALLFLGAFSLGAWREAPFDKIDFGLKFFYTLVLALNLYYLLTQPSVADEDQDLELGWLDQLKVQFNRAFLGRLPDANVSDDELRARVVRLKNWQWRMEILRVFLLVINVAAALAFGCALAIVHADKGIAPYSLFFLYLAVFCIFNTVVLVGLAKESRRQSGLPANVNTPEERRLYIAAKKRREEEAKRLAETANPPQG